MKHRLNYNPLADFYELLGVLPAAAPDEIQRAYHRRAKEVHPDTNPDRREWATHAFKQLTEAYDVLNDPALRAQYDELRWLHQTYAPPPSRPAAAPPPEPPRPRPPSPTYDDLKWPRKTAQRRQPSMRASSWIVLLFLLSAALLFLLSAMFYLGEFPAVGPFAGPSGESVDSHADIPTVVVAGSAPGCAQSTWTISRLVLEVDAEFTPLAVRAFGAADVGTFALTLTDADHGLLQRTAPIQGPVASGGFLARIVLPRARNVTYLVALHASDDSRPTCQVPLVIE